MAAASSRSSQADSSPTPQDIQPGDLVWLKPTGSGVDLCLELARVREVPDPQSEVSRANRPCGPLNQPRGAADGLLAPSCSWWRPPTLLPPDAGQSPPLQGPQVHPPRQRGGPLLPAQPAVISVPEARLRNGPDPFTLPGVTVLREDGLDERAPPTSDQPQPRVEIYDLFSGNQVRRALQSSAIVVQLAYCWAAPSTNNAPCWLLGGN